MRATVLFSLLSFGGGLLAGVIECIQHCETNQFPILWPNGGFKRCIDCELCHPGFGLYPNCGEKITHPPNISCKPCENGKTFSQEYDSSGCKSCHLCAQHEIVTQDCTPRSDTLCSGTCVQGYFYHNSTRDCQKCSHCCNDGEDEKQQECINQRLYVTHQHCAPRPDKTCGPTLAPTTESDQQQGHGKISLILSIVGIIIGVLLGAGFAVYCAIRIRRRTISQRNEGNAEDVTTKNVRDYVGLETGIIERSKEMQDKEGYPESRSSKPCVFRNVTDSRADDESLVVEDKPHKREKKEKNVQDHVGPETVTVPRSKGMQDRCNAGYSESRPSTPQVFYNVTDSHADDESLVVQDKPHKRKKKEKNGFTIEEHPETQTKPEGSRVELKCVVKGEKEVIYEWFKDERRLTEEKNSSLIFDPLTVQDFGFYRCELRSCADADQHKSSFVTSRTAELDVAPSDGRRYSRLEELFKNNFNTREKVENLLCTVINGRRAWKQVAGSHKMDDLSLIERCTNPGKEVIDFLLASNPTLTVYSFCKELKEKSIRRLDIVAELEGYLTEPC